MLVRKILEKCHELGGSSLALPMIGAGKHGFPEKAVLQAIKDEVNQLSSSQRDHLVLKTIRVIVFQSKSERIKSVPLPTMPCTGTHPTTEQKKENAGNSSNEIAFGPVRIHLCGIDTKQCEADALINVLSKYVLTPRTTGNREIPLADSMAEKPMKPPLGSVLVKKADNPANVQYDMHCVPVALNNSGVERAIKACLIAAQFFPLNSILISAVGITSLGVAKEECVNALLNASKMFSSANFTIDINVVEIDTHTMQIFKKAFEKIHKEQKSSGDIRESGQGANLEDARTQQERHMGKILNFGGKEEVIFRVVGFNETVNTSIQKIDEFFNRFKERKCVKDEKVVNGFWNHDSEIKRLLKKYQVFITVSADEVSFEGMAKQVFECKDELTEYLNKQDEKHRELELKQKDLERYREISKSVQWSYSDVNATVLFDEILNGMVESQFKLENGNTIIPEIGDTHEIDLDDMVIWEKDTGYTALLARKEMENTTGKF